MSHKMVHKIEPLFATILPEWSYIQCKLTNHLKKIDPKGGQSEKNRSKSERIFAFSQIAGGQGSLTPTPIGGRQIK